jgi:hypothetical protein
MSRKQQFLDYVASLAGMALVAAVAILWRFSRHHTYRFVPLPPQRDQRGSCMLPK